MADDPERKAAVFISYARVDFAFAERLRTALCEYGFEAYLDKHDILPGEPWQERLGNLITVADTVLFVLSPTSIASVMCDWEVNEAERLAKRLIPVVHVMPDDQSVPGRLKRLNYIFLRDETEWRSELPTLLEALLTDIEWIREHTRLSELSARWAAKAREAEALLLRGSELAAAETWLSRRPPGAPEITRDQTAFIAGSRSAERRNLLRSRNRNRLIAAISVVALAVMGVLAWYFVDAWQEALRANSRFLGEIAQQQIAASDPVTGVLLALEALGDKDARDTTARIRQWMRPFWGGHENEASRALKRGVPLLNAEPSLGDVELVYSASYSDDGRLLLLVSPDAVRIADAQSGAVRAVLAVETHDLADIARFSSDNKDVLITSRFFGIARIWNVETGRPRATLVGHSAGIRFAAFAPDNRSVVTTSQAWANLWNAKTGALIAPLEGYTGFRYSLAYSPDGTRLIEEMAGPPVRIWDAATGKVSAVLEGTRIGSARFAADGKRVATVSQDGTVALWDVATGKEIAVFRNPSDEKPMLRETYAVDLTADGKKIMGCFFGGTIIVWDIETRQQLLAIKGPSCLEASFSPDGSRIISRNTSPTAWVWDATTGRPVTSLGVTSERRGLYQAMFSPDGSQVMTRSGDHVVRIWDSSTGKEIFSIGRSPYDANGYLVVPPQQDLINQAKRAVPRCLTAPQRRHFNLSKDVPSWCRELRKWPYDGVERPVEPQRDVD